MNIEKRLNAIDARLSARAADLEQRIADRFGSTDAANRQTAAKAPDGPEGARRREAADASMAAQRPDGIRHGLFVGVNEYAVYSDGHRPGSLNGCVTDARNMRDACCELGGWSRTLCRVLEDRGATRHAIRDALARIAFAARPGDVVLYFHSSHGGRDSKADPENDTHLCAYDRPYSEAEIWSDLAGFKKGVKLICIIDACHSGGLIDKDSSAPGSGMADELARRIEARFRAATRPDGGIRIEDIGWITAAAGTQYSLDAGKIGGLFATRTLVNEGWRGGAADGYTQAILSMGGESAVQSAQAATDLHVMGVPQPVGCATFLDLALYACRTWKDRFSSSEEGLLQHIPQFFNPTLLASVVAGRTGR